ncbi:MAG: DNA gyrase/topoisomerase IV subunit A [Bacteroides sp.]|nr:DNA gyrase/topoisomerase IV subunit A [Bacteroides sp.]MCM1095655.1 DNA gyrase/topoisomerase IV subunit A [Terasakiella sp.]
MTDEDPIIPEDNPDTPATQEQPAAADAKPYCAPGDVVRHQLRGMFQTWFLDYASYVILERAVPNIDDGLKPVQRRILYSMKTLDDGRYNKVANIVGNTMQYHPHGDASIYEALVQLGQKELLVDTQGNWGNVLTGDSAAAGRYIEARLSQFALDVLYNDRVTDWTVSYDGRNREPVTLPSKFPLLLAQGAEGIAVGLSSKILPHNFNELIDASVAYLEGRPFELVPDFFTGGYIDVSRYNDGRRGGVLKVRAKIEKVDNRTLAITEIPFGRTVGTVIDSILKAFEKGKIKIRRVDNNTAEHARILVHLLPGTSSDKAIDALYAFTDCEVSISPNCCVIVGDKPEFLGVSDVLRHSADRTLALLRADLEQELAELRDKMLYASLERIFIEERIYKDAAYEQAPSTEAAVAHIRGRLAPYEPSLTRPVTDDDILRLLEIRMKRILRFNADDADRAIARLGERIAETLGHLDHLVEYAVEWYRGIKEKYGHAFPRRTVVRGFDSIEAATVAEATEKLYINREEGFIGTGLKKDEYVCPCSDIDDIILFFKDGRYKIVKVQDKLSIGKGTVIHLAVFKRKDTRTIYNVIYRDGKTGPYMMKRFAATGLTRGTEYDMTRGTEGSRVMWFSANPNGEAEVVKVVLKPRRGLKKLQIDVDFAQLAVKGRGSIGNIVTRNEVQRFSLKGRGVSTLGGLQIWWDRDVLRLNTEGRGEYLGEFAGDDQVLVITRTGEFYTTSFQTGNHYDDNILRIEKFDPDKVWTAILNDADQGYPYIKRFRLEPSARRQRYLTDNERSTLIALSDEYGAMFRVTFAAPDDFRDPLTVDADEFIGIKSFKARGKRLTTYAIASVEELEPKAVAVPEPEPAEPAGELAPDEADQSDDEIRDELSGQQRLFD